jgi:Cyclophilin type peptidyl-prolyl cis-trans isomerase/CLD.
MNLSLTLYLSVVMIFLQLQQLVDSFSFTNHILFPKHNNKNRCSTTITRTSRRSTITSTFTTSTTRASSRNNHNQDDVSAKRQLQGDSSSRRMFLRDGLMTGILLSSGISSFFLDPSVALSAEPPVQPTTTPMLSQSSANAKITCKIFIQLKGLPTDESNDIRPQDSDDVITIGLFELDAPQPTAILKQLVSNEGYPAKCKPKEVRTLQREQLEANKVYNACMETQDSKGVNYDLSTVWRVVKDERIDLGAVSGKYVSRESPIFQGGNEMLKHDVEGVVSVRKGNDGGFGFTIYPGSSNNNNNNGGSSSNVELDQDNIVVGRVIGGMNVVKRLNDLPVVQSPIGGGGSSNKRIAPSRACRYGSTELYCNEFKPLKKILIQNTGLINESN